MMVAWRGVVSFVAALAVGAWSATAGAADVTIPLSYSSDGGYTATGSVTFDDSIWTPSIHISDLADMTSFALTVTGPQIPAGQTYTKVDLTQWYFDTNASNQITDLNFFMDTEVRGCAIKGVEVFLLGIFCNNTQVATLQLLTFVAPPPSPVPVLSRPWSWALAGALALAGLVALRRRPLPARRRAD